MTSQFLGAAAVFTHPNALVGVLAVIVLAVVYDRKRIRAWHLPAAAVPYCLFLAAWSVYILESPSDFTAQFFANAAGRGSVRWKLILQPWLAVWKEVERHLGVYAASGVWPGIMNPPMIFVPIFYVCGLLWFSFTRKRHGSGACVFLAIAGTYLAAMTFLNGFKLSCYFIYLLPLYNAVLAVWLVTLWRGRPDHKLTAAALAAAFLTLQITATVQHIKANEYERDFMGAVRAVRSYQREGKTVVGSTFLGAGLGFSGFRDDTRLGMYTGSKPDIIVMDRSYRYFNELFAEEEPAVFDHVASTLTSQYRPAFLHGSFWIFERVPSSNAPPWLDIGKLSLQPAAEKADYLFEALANSVNPQARTGRALP
jgi:hypothetical protein